MSGRGRGGDEDVFASEEDSEERLHWSGIFLSSYNSVSFLTEITLRLHYKHKLISVV
jgi:hypothetical protein